jgi:hypothetical protein
LTVTQVRHQACCCSGEIKTSKRPSVALEKFGRHIVKKKATYSFGIESQ